MTTVGIVEDNAVVRQVLEQLIDDTPGMRCVCVCDSAEQALRLVPRHQPAVVLMDIHLPNRSGIECTAKLKELLPELQVIILTVYEDTETIFKALKAGACGYLLKRSKPERIVAAVQEVRFGGAPMTSEIARKVVAAFHGPVSTDLPAGTLSRREQEILELLARGLANKEIANQLSLSIETVRVHLRHIYDKLHVRSRTQAVAKFMGAGTEGSPAVFPSILPRGSKP
jgi:DNA-binding NarL/FixJ family response regulator